MRRVPFVQREAGHTAEIAQHVIADFAGEKAVTASQALPGFTAVFRDV